MGVIADTSSRAQWVEGMEKFQILEGNIESEAIIYEFYNFPWPIADRDTVTRSVARLDYRKKEIDVKFTNTTHRLKPPVRGVVRIPKAAGEMFFRYESRNKTYTRNIIALDIGGRIPFWLVDQIVRKIPVKTLESLQEQVAKTKGKYQEFINKHQKLIDEQSELR